MKYQPPVEFPLSGPAAPGTSNSNPTAPYVDGDPVAGIEGSIPPAAAIEHPMREIVYAIEQSGQIPNHADQTQLHKAIKQRVADDVAVVNDGTGIALYRGKKTDAAKSLRFSSLKPGPNVSIVLEDDGPGQQSIRISATGGGGGGGGSTISGEGVSIAVGGEANLNFPGLTNQPLVDDSDLFAFFNQTQTGPPSQTAGHRNITAAQLRDWINGFVQQSIITNNLIQGSDVLHDGWSATDAGYATLGASTPTYALPDVDLAKVGGLLTVIGTLRAVAVPNGQVLVEASFDNGATWVVIETHLATRSNVSPLPIGVGESQTFGGQVWFEWRAASNGARQIARQTGAQRAVLQVTVAAAASSVIKTRLRYTGTGAPFRVNGVRLISDHDRPLLIGSSDGGYGTAGGNI
jgi:hypothetical protein